MKYLGPSNKYSPLDSSQILLLADWAVDCHVVQKSNCWLVFWQQMTQPRRTEEAYKTVSYFAWSEEISFQLRFRLAHSRRKIFGAGIFPCCYFQSSDVVVVFFGHYYLPRLPCSRGKKFNFLLLLWLNKSWSHGGFIKRQFAVSFIWCNCKKGSLFRCWRWQKNFLSTII